MHFARITVAALVAGVVLAAPAGSLGAPAQAAHLRLVETTPLTVRGTGFKPHERVKVVYATADLTRTVRTAAGAGGGFVARFAGVHFDACQLPRIVAVGSRGSRAVLKVVPPACPAP
jgi:hypothetical protein